ncbi:BRCT domain-containing protein [Zopfochytrium polystomum]|nr:BRCT domain-containing protein [Zopfochytrium polystomum]
MVEAVSQEFTVGKVDAGMAILLSPDHHLIEFPATILPDGVTTGSIINVTIERNTDEERRKREEFLDMQETIFRQFSKCPEPPVISLRSLTQTSAIIQWKPLVLHNADLRGIDIYRNEQKLSSPSVPLTAQSAKLSGMDVSTEYKVQVVIRTFRGRVPLDSLIALLSRVGARYTDDLSTDNTHLVCTFARGPKYEKALEWNIPAVSPEFLKACEQNGKVMPAHSYYVQGSGATRLSLDK